MASSSHISNSDDDDFQDGLRSLTKEEEVQYYRALEESEGFDVPYFGSVFAFGIIAPLTGDCLSSRLEEIQELADEAIKHYNHEHDKNYEVVEIVKANHQAACGIMYYITFEVKEIGEAAEFSPITFEAQVLAGIPPNLIEVELCRPKPSPLVN